MKLLGSGGQSRIEHPDTKLGNGLARSLASISWRFHKGTVALLFLLPSLVFLSIFTFWPIVWTLWTSLHSRVGRQQVFVGIDNYIWIFTDPAALQVVRNTLVYMVGALLLSVFGGLLLALLLNQPLKGIRLLRFPFLGPIALPMVSVASIWLFLYAPQIGLINEVLQFFGMPRYNWLGDRRLALAALFVVYTWKQIGYFALFYLAGLQALPDDVMDAARLDGAEYWSKLRYIIWPLVSPTTYFISTIGILNSLQSIDHVFVLTSGGPNNATNMALYYVYEQAFKYFNTGLGAAVTVLLLGVLLTLAILQYVYLERRVHYE